jgi:hypothetical protein
MVILHMVAVDDLFGGLEFGGFRLVFSGRVGVMFGGVSGVGGVE